MQRYIFFHVQTLCIYDNKKTGANSSSAPGLGYIVGANNYSPLRLFVIISPPRNRRPGPPGRCRRGYHPAGLADRPAG